MPYKDKADQAASARRHYEKNRQAMIERAAKHSKAVRSEISAWLREIKNSTPCADCHASYPYYVMQFDHVRGEKLFNLGTRSERWSWPRARDEVEKCDVVCANCHAERTHRRVVAATGFEPAISGL